MAMLPAKVTSLEKFNPFNVYTTSYKKVGDHAIGVDVLIPKGLDSKKAPLMVRFHGGFLTTGASMLPMMFTNWILDLAKANSAIIVSADYRFLPEASGTDILEDVDDVWSWIHDGSLQAFLNNSLGNSAPVADLQHVLSVGDSAGGYLAIQSAIGHPNDIKMVVALYPQLDMASPYYNTAFDKPMLGMPMVPSQVIDNHLAKSPRGTPVTTAVFPDRVDIAVAIPQNGRTLEFLGSDPKLLPFETVKNTTNLPAICILHGEDDQVVPVDGSKRFAEIVKKAIPDVPIRLDIQPGDHAFDAITDFDAEWLQPNIEFIKKYWLG